MQNLRQTDGWLRQFWLKNLLRVFPYWFESPGGMRIDCRRRYEIAMCKIFSGHYPMQHVRRPVRTIFDIGANMGLFSLACVEQFGGELREIVAVEPSRNTFRRMRRNFARNPVPAKVFLVNEAVDAEQGQKVFRIGQAHYSSSLEPAKVKSPRGTQMVAVTTLDELKRRHGIDAVDLVKIDVEGSELGVLRGAGEVLRTARTLFVEAHRGFCTRGDLEQILSPLGFTLISWDGSLVRDHGDFCFVRRD